MAVARSSERKSVFFGWKVVGVVFVLTFFSFGVGFASLPIILQTLHATRGWPISTISAAITTHFLVSAALVVYLPEAHRRFGLARVTLTGFVLLTLGVLAWGCALHPSRLFLAALVSGCGWAATSAAAINAMIAPWFNRDRPKALSLAFNGSNIGGIVAAVVWVALIAELGLPLAAGLIGAITIAVVLPLGMRYLTVVPSDLGLAPDGLSQPSAIATAPGVSLSRKQLLGDRCFITISAAFALGMFAQVGLLAHLFARLVADLGPGMAAVAISLSAACAIVGRTAFGWLLRERNRRTAAAANFVLQAIGAATLGCGDGPMTLFLGCILFGLGVGNIMTFPALIAQQEFDRASIGTIVALITAINQAVFAFAPAILGGIHDLTGSYAVAFGVACGVQLAAAVVVVSVRRAGR